MSDSTTSPDRSPARPPQVIERGLKGAALLLAILAPAAIYAGQLHAWMGAALAMPDMVSHEHNYVWALNIGMLQILMFARPGRAGHWGQMAAVAAAYPTASILIWWGAVSLLSYLAPEHEFGLFTGLLLLVTGYAFGFLPYLAIHRLAGAHSPWHAEDDPAGEPQP